MTTLDYAVVFAYVAAFIYEQDAPLAERKAQALTLDRALLSELLGQAELRELIDADVLAELEAELKYLTEDYHARDADEVHDLLRRLGDLDEVEIAERTARDPGPLLSELRRQRRAVTVERLSDTGVRISEGLQPGEWIAVAGVHFLTEGQEVRILDAPED